MTVFFLLLFIPVCPLFLFVAVQKTKWQFTPVHFMLRRATGGLLATHVARIRPTTVLGIMWSVVSVGTPHIRFGFGPLLPSLSRRSRGTRRKREATDLGETKYEKGDDDRGVILVKKKKKNGG